jgi:hypothetical protein
LIGFLILGSTRRTGTLTQGVRLNLTDTRLSTLHAFFGSLFVQRLPAESHEFQNFSWLKPAVFPCILHGVGYIKSIASPTAGGGCVQPHFIHHPFIILFLTPNFLATRRTVNCHFQFGMMDKTLFVMQLPIYFEQHHHA